MPIYEYQAVNLRESCLRCKGRFEVIQISGEGTLQNCPECGARVKKLFSRCFGVVVEAYGKAERTGKQIRAYERSGMWSHAAELADTVAEKTQDSDLRNRAMENYRKAGHEVD